MTMTLENKIDAPEDRAIYWHTRLEAGGLTKPERQAFHDWLEADSTHSRLFEEAAELSRRMSDLGTHQHFAALKDTAFGASVHETTAMVVAHRQNKASSTRRRFMAIAALFLVAASGVWFAVNQPAKDDATTYMTAIGQQKTIMLADGSVITLNTNSEISVALTPEVRRLHLTKGEAYFEVAKDKHRPFEVAVGNSFVTAVGTAFNIRRTEDDVTVLVTEGIVKVKAPSAVPTDANDTEAEPTNTEMLVAGDQLVLGGMMLSRSKLDQQAREHKTFWRQGKILIDQKTVSEIVAQIQPYIPEKIIIADDGVANMTAGGVFEVGKVQSFFDALEVALPVKVVRESDVIVLRRRAVAARDI